MNLTDRIIKALKSRDVRDGIGGVIQHAVEEHISRSAGRKGPLKPLKPLYGLYEKRVRKSKKFGHVTIYGVQGSYRNGGQPLKDTGRLERSIRCKVVNTPEGMRAIVLGEPYGEPHERGFATKGPNFIPLTQKAKRAYAAGVAFVPGKLKQGKDYIMAWNGVKVPARPYMQPTREDMRTIGKSIYHGLKAALGGH